MDIIYDIYPDIPVSKAILSWSKSTDILQLPMLTRIKLTVAKAMEEMSFALNAVARKWESENPLQKDSKQINDSCLKMIDAFQNW